MRHRNRTIKLGRTASHRDALMAALVRGLIRNGRIRTTVAKAKAARGYADRMVTLAKRGTLAARRVAAARLRAGGPGAGADAAARKLWHDRHDALRKLFAQVAPAFADRQGGYTRVLKLGRRPGDGAEMALLEWTNYVAPAPRPKKEKGKGAAKSEGAAKGKAEEPKAAPAKA